MPPKQSALAAEIADLVVRLELAPDLAQWAATLTAAAMARSTNR